MNGDGAAVSVAVAQDEARPEQRRLRPASIGRFMAVWTAAWWIPVSVLLPSSLPGRWAVLAALALLATVPIPLLLRAFVNREYPSARRRLFVFRPFWYLQLFMPLAAIAGLLGAIAGLPFGASTLVGAWTLTLAVVCLGVLVTVGYIGSRQLVTRPLDLTFPDLPDGLHGLRIVQISDLHVGPHTPRSFLARVAAQVAHANGDLLVITGDQVDDFAEDVEGFVRAFGHLTAPLGVFAVAGNHDVYAGWDGVRGGLEAARINVLVNDAVPLTWQGSTFWLAGTGDPAANAAFAGADGPAPDIERTLAGVPAGAFVVALAHNPALWPALAERGVHLTLSGHTHYGQFAIPKLGWSVASLFLRHALGVHREGQSTLYINPGTNYWGIPFRVGTPPEISVVTIRRA